jgi:hypothetical protein
MSGRLEKLLRVFRAQMTARHRARQDNSTLPFTDAEFAALIRSPHPDAMKFLASGLAHGEAKTIGVRPPTRGGLITRYRRRLSGIRKPIEEKLNGAGREGGLCF